MMRSMYAGVSGLKAHQTRMDIVGNNIANVNTTGYKASRATFKEMISQTLQGAKAAQDNRGGMNPQQVGLGVMLGSIDTDLTQGNLQSTGRGDDLAIAGNGYFVVNDGSQNYYTRAGALTTDNQGNLVNSSNGYIMQGWMADDYGNINTSGEPEGLLIPVGATMSPQATANAYFQGNFDSNTAGGTNWTSTINIFDSLGEMHTVTVDFTRQVQSPPTTGTIDFGAWTLQADAGSPDADLNGITFAFGADTDTGPAYSYDPDSKTFTFTGDWDGSSVAAPTIAQLEGFINGQLGAGSVTLTTTGTYDAADLADADDLKMSAPADNRWNYTVDVSDGSINSGGSGSISFNPDGTISSGGTSNINFDPAGGAAAGQEVTLDFSEITQSSASTKEEENKTSVTKKRADGHSMGSLQSYSINSAGELIGGFSNGLKRKLGQLAISSFTNPAGLTREGGSLYSESQNSGMAQIGTASTLGRGKIVAGNLEMSNANLSDQFTDMITTQRGFQANSKIITTTDEMLQELVNLKR
ncbi:flagellar hook-basal body complex protein [Iocasia frigidifontis]|uniref:Flagellar hook protein FlgE n=1 Tax=Iocasia fonsfrigidae TaxID=2682810 RepID=A0A8A7KFM8_9FIRM|nr:flagellar hook protein FlgE [Iocasia fonsfrigidae]QTL96964.1 flagellar hook-basal body complex protein [Iocasia fonsfrigidae]